MKIVMDAKRLLTVLKTISQFTDIVPIRHVGKQLLLEGMANGGHIYFKYAYNTGDPSEFTGGIKCSQLLAALKGAKTKVTLEMGDTLVMLCVGNRNVSLPMIDAREFAVGREPNLHPTTTIECDCSAFTDALASMSSLLGSRDDDACDLVKTPEAVTLLWRGQGGAKVSDKIACTMRGEHCASSYGIEYLQQALSFGGSVEMAWGNDYPLRITYTHPDGADSLRIVVAVRHHGEDV